jgi:hypothetical protein
MYSERENSNRVDNKILILWDYTSCYTGLRGIHFTNSKLYNKYFVLINSRVMIYAAVVNVIETSAVNVIEFDVDDLDIVLDFCFDDVYVVDPLTWNAS